MTLRCASVCLLLLGLSSGARSAEPPPASPPAPAGASAPVVPTVIESGSAEMVSTTTETTFTFRNGVTVSATNMKLTCDELVVVAKRTGDAAATVGKQEQFKSLVASGNVRLVQNDREATCGRAVVYPGEDKVELTEKPTVRSVKEGWTQTGPKMVLYRGQRRAVIEGTATERPTLVLPPLKDLGDLGIDKDKEKKRKEAAEKAATDKPASEKPAPEEPAPAITVPGITPPPPK